MKHILKTMIFIICLIGMMGGIALAEQVEDWPHEKPNEVPENMTHVFYDFENGTSFSIYKQDLDTCEFVDVPSEYSYFGFDEPSYVSKYARAMHIYPYDYYYDPDGSHVDYIWIVNGDSAFAPRSMNKLGQYYPGIGAKIIINENVTINYFSFLASTGCTLSVTIYDPDENFLLYEKIYSNIYREGYNASEFTQFYVYFPEHIIGQIELTGAYNGWHVDDMILGFSDIQPNPDPEPTPDPEPEPMPPEEALYEWAAERLKLLAGAPHNPIGFGYEFQTGTFYPAEDIVSNPLVVNWDYENKEWVTGEGINNPAAIIWAFNKDSNIINNLDLNDMESKDFKVLVEYGDQKPGDVAFIEYDTGDTTEGSTGYDEVIVFIEPQVDLSTGMVEDCIRVSKEDGVHYSDSEFLHSLYGTTVGPETTSLFTVKSMPKTPKGNKKSPYPNIPGKYKI